MDCDALAALVVGGLDNLPNPLSGCLFFSVYSLFSNFHVRPVLYEQRARFWFFTKRDQKYLLERLRDNVTAVQLMSGNREPI